MIATPPSDGIGDAPISTPSNSIELFGGTIMSPIRNPWPVYRRLRREHPVLPIRGIFGIENLVTRYDDVQTILRDPARFSSRANARGIGIVMGRTIIEMEGKEHVRHRNLIAPFFSPRALREELGDNLRRIAHELIDTIAEKRSAELVAEFTFTYPLRVIAEIIGIPIGDFHSFHHMALDLISIADDPPKGLAAAQQLAEYLSPIVSERRREPRPDLLSELVHGEVEGKRLSDEEILSFLRLLLPAGADTTYRLIGTTLYALLTHRDQLDEVLADRSRISLAIEEALRWESPVQYVSRETTEDLTLGETPLEAGTVLFVCLGSANRDERHFADPDRFDMRRRADDHVAFGFGPHFCAGSHLARMEASVALSALLDRLPDLRLDPSGETNVVGLAFRSPDRLPVLFG
jgi:cytochrome P450